MSEWVRRTDRLPEEMDADSNNDVWASRNGEVRAAKYWTIKGYTYCYLWVIEGIKWFIEQLDAGKVVKEGKAPG